MQNYQYVSDDGNTYQLAQPPSYQTVGVGGLTPAIGTEPLYPPFQTPRYIRGVASSDPNAFVLVVCDSSNLLYQAGVGTVFSIGAFPYVVESCIGEQRILS